jgi:hypothetical protein
MLPLTRYQVLQKALLKEFKVPLETWAELHTLVQQRLVLELALMALGLHQLAEVCRLIPKWTTEWASSTTTNLLLAVVLVEVLDNKVTGKQMTAV